MNSPHLTPAARLSRFTARPSYLIKIICQMLLGIGVAVALITKVYMLVLTDYQCQPDLNSLGNKIRCGNTLYIMAHGLALSAGFELAYRLFNVSIYSAIDPLIIGVCSAFLLTIAAMDIDTATWQIAAVIVSITFSLGVLLYCKERFSPSADSHQARGDHNVNEGINDSSEHR